MDNFEHAAREWLGENGRLFTGRKGRAKGQYSIPYDSSFCYMTWHPMHDPHGLIYGKADNKRNAIINLYHKVRNELFWACDKADIGEIVNS